MADLLTTTITGGLTVNDGLTQLGALSMGNTTLTGTLFVSDQFTANKGATIADGLTVTGNTQLEELSMGNATSSGTLSVENGATIKGTGDVLKITKNDTESTPILTVNSNGTITTSSGLAIAVEDENIAIKNGSTKVLTIDSKRKYYIKCRHN